ncbi:hypothetical protein [Cryobacterium sp. TMS1-13-1]|uniref:hypothetical protein n=1 Tax=Cryobacterium sp. TMS1-13-1 TaxID=1259220 RepID=UPI00106AB96E|nr:hypothetical protein [Cryobacterium sp. TMS1-13-1]TFD22895.1 hypothetical protein E3T31_05760 [Cryobacterium sp. TMS1-13-1]
MDPTHSIPLDAAGAAQLLKAADTARARAAAAVDHRTLARARFGLAGALFIYLSAFLLVFGNQTQDAVSGAGANGYAYTNVLLIPFLVFTQLMQGVQNRARVLRTHRRVLRFVLLGMIPFGIAGALSILDIRYPWGLNLLVAAAPAAPLLWLAGKSARRAGPPTPAVRTALSRPAATMTGALGLFFGVTGLLAAFSWFPVAGLGLALVLVALLTLWSSRWGLPSVGSEWSAPQWTGFAVSFMLLVTLAVVLARTPWNTPLVGVLGGVLVALPLVVAAVRGPRS